jgi:hypothetical protein
MIQVSQLQIIIIIDFILLPILHCAVPVIGVVVVDLGQ